MKRFNALSLCGLLVSMAIFAAGCSSVDVRSKGNIYNDTVKNYAKLLRWGFYEDAYAYHKLRDEEGELESVDFDMLKEVRITSLKMKSKAMDETTMEGEFSFSLDYYNNYTGYVHSLNVSQPWWFDEEAEGWFVDAQFPKLR